VKADRLYTAIRIDKALRAPDALQRSCAGSANTDLYHNEWQPAAR